ncbi:MAG TPA: rhodanese-like domain-containing protein [Microvirga sp.]|jgi:rhodanese-related sulfurtransferase|nr:rhodanese-like domain-containing protein [Microvirga sp.]
MAAISSQAAKVRLHASGEIACLDVREHGQYGEGHPFLAVPCPYSRLESLIVRLVPRAGTPIILVDDGDGVSQRAALRLEALGYRSVDWVAGGAPAWAEAGFTLFKGVNVPSKTLGELVEQVWHVPQIEPATLHAWRDESRKFRVFDGRPASEYSKMTIPGSRCMPNGELAHRWGSAGCDDDTVVVINCAGRTRSIIGAAGLMLAGMTKVYALENGTQGWALSGRELERGATPAALPEADAQDSRARARALAERHSIPWVDLATAEHLASEVDRTTFLFDVRDPTEQRSTPHAAALAAPGGQLIQATDQWIGVRRSRVIVADDTGMRATLASFWLRQLGFESYVLPDILSWPSDWRLRNPDAPSEPTLREIQPIRATDAVARANEGAVLLDLRSSTAFRAGHLNGASWATRARLPKLQPGSTVLAIGETDVVSLAACDLNESGAHVLHVQGEEASWQVSGLPSVSTPQDPPDGDAIDFLFFVHDRHDGNLEAARRYIAWETGLVPQLDEQERGEFRIESVAFS